MAYIGYDELWRSDFYNNVSAIDKKQDKSLTQIKPKVNDTFFKKKQQNVNLLIETCCKQSLSRPKVI